MLTTPTTVIPATERELQARRNQLIATIAMTKQLAQDLGNRAVALAAQNIGNEEMQQVASRHLRLGTTTSIGLGRILDQIN